MDRHVVGLPWNQSFKITRKPEHSVSLPRNRSLKIVIPHPDQGWAPSSAAESLETLKNVSSISWVIVQMSVAKLPGNGVSQVPLLLNETDSRNFTPAVSSAEAEKYQYNLTATS